MRSKEYYINKYIPRKFREYITGFYKDDCGWWVEIDANDYCHFDDCVGSGSEITQHEDTLLEVVDVTRRSLTLGPVSDEYRH